MANSPKNIESLSCSEGSLYLIVPKYRLSVLESRFVRNGQLLTTLCASCSQNLAAVSCRHSRTETVLVDSLAARWLVSSLHCHNRIVFIVLTSSNSRENPFMRGAKVQPFFDFAKENAKICFFSTLQRPLQTSLNSLALLLVARFIQECKHILLVCLNTRLVERIYSEHIATDATRLLKEVEQRTDRGLVD